MQALYEILVILAFLACMALGGSGALGAWRPLLRRYWASLLGGTAFLFLLLLALTLGGLLTVGVRR
jgi:hypothetical protein